jgi:hypothetical protein
VGSESASIVTRPIDVTSMRAILTVITTIVTAPMSPQTDGDRMHGAISNHFRAVVIPADLPQTYVG